MKKQIITLAALVGGFVLGASALVALADPTWTYAPAGGPPNNNVAAPINVGAVTQTRSGLLGLSNLMVNSLQVLTGEGTTTTNTTIVTGGIAGKVLTAIDSNGTVGWRAATLQQNSCEWTDWTGYGYSNVDTGVSCPAGKYAAGFKMDNADPNHTDADRGRIYCCTP